MEQQRHIVNKQIVEIELPKTADVSALQENLSAICREQLTTIIDAILSKKFGESGSKNIQIDRLVIDLGAVQLEDLTTVFAEKFEERIIAAQESDEIINVPTEKTPEAQKTPLRVLSHYLSTGLLPWWAEDTSKAFLQSQLEVLLATSEITFVKMIGQLQFNTVYLARFLATFRETQVLASLQSMTTSNLQGLIPIKKELVDLIQKKGGLKNAGDLNRTITSTFWKAAFHQLPLAKDFEALKKECVQQTLLELGVDSKGEAKENKDLRAIQLLVKEYSKHYPKDSVWQQFFEQVSKLVKSPSFNRVHPNSLKECSRLLFNIALTKKNNTEKRKQQERLPQNKDLRKKEEQKSDQENVPKNKDLENNNEQKQDQEKIATTDLLQPLAEHLMLMRKSISQLKQDANPMVMDQLKSQFDDTDFITIHNAGLILFWPFLARFFENLELIIDKTFRNEEARNKAISALQYLCGEADEALFEGAFPLNKILCGVSLEDPVVPIPLSANEKEMAEDLIQAVIQRGPHWTNLSVAGFQKSYLRRQGSLRLRDGHWLLQVQKETYDITLEKLPWSISTVKLPWMNEIIIVEWN